MWSLRVTVVAFLIYNPEVSIGETFCKLVHCVQGVARMGIEERRDVACRFVLLQLRALYT